VLTGPFTSLSSLRASINLDNIGSSMHIDAMDTFGAAQRLVDEHLEELSRVDPLEAIRRSTTLLKQIEDHQHEAVRAAVATHTWTEIGSALGVSKQAAHQRYVRSLAARLETTHRSAKSALRAGEPAAAERASVEAHAVATELRSLRHP